MGTVDIRDYLKDQVSTSGIVNSLRAVRAAELSQDRAIRDAIAQARIDIIDIEELNSVGVLKSHPQSAEFVLPLPSSFKL